MWIVGVICLFLASYAALMNIAGCIAGARRRRKGIEGGYSNVPLVSLLFSTLAWYLTKEQIGLWAFLPAILDPGTLMTLLAPVVLPWIFYKDFRRRKDESNRQ